MPKGDTRGRMYGFQLWANLPAQMKMTAPRYQEVKAAAIPVVKDNDGAQVRIVCGRYGATNGPVKGVAADPVYLDVSLLPGQSKNIQVAADHNAFAYVFEGSAQFGSGSEAENHTLALFGDGDEITVKAGSKGVRFLLVSGKPLREPVAWHGPIVMNTQAELQRAFQELENGTFLKEQATTD
jgi:redox-sensitive bicupin YhaK (pirin superfamily)